ncbi:hypothetical protein [Candidatus Parabeggiatoa sp. HSG14]|uniref:hypothetical protein n=1 Tax=Candidatus Parabeggiatoa sp. HSG14 TaxID=3055593 RepID=UPI0025A8D6F2|nr:hypothetical protein [Thiotrichales bacterium HSG14]
MKYKIIGISTTIVLAFSVWVGSNSFAQQHHGAHAQGTGCGQGTGQPCGQGMRSGQSNEQIADDNRQFVQMPAMPKKIMQQRMLSNLVALTQIIGLLANNKLEDAASVAETQIGNRSIGAGTGMGPGRFMPIGMRKIGRSLHKSVDEFARIARTGETTKAYIALQNITNICVACHTAYRTQ